MWTKSRPSREGWYWVVMDAADREAEVRRHDTTDTPELWWNTPIPSPPTPVRQVELRENPPQMGA